LEVLAEAFLRSECLSSGASSSAGRAHCHNSMQFKPGFHRLMFSNLILYPNDDRSRSSSSRPGTCLTSRLGQGGRGGAELSVGAALRLPRSAGGDAGERRGAAAPYAGDGSSHWTRCRGFDRCTRYASHFGSADLSAAAGKLNIGCPGLAALIIQQGDKHWDATR
jgi:hypothetical protein